MSTSVKELKQQQRQPITDDESDQRRSLVGQVVAFAIYPDTLVAATVTAADGNRIDYRWTRHSSVRREAPADGSGMLRFVHEPLVEEVFGKGCRHQDPCQREDGPPLAAPQSGHFVPGTWFDPSPYVITIDCIKDPVAEVRATPKVPGTLGTLLQTATPGKREMKGPFTSFAEACEAFRLAKPQFDLCQMLFQRRG